MTTTAARGGPEVPPVPATVMVLTRNSAATLSAALSSVGEFAEVIVCDGGSTDDTVAIAAAHGARVIDQDPRFLDADGRLRDYAGARHQVVRAAREPWIFQLDADELATPDLTEALRRAAVADDGVAAWRCAAHHVVDGTVVRSAANYPMRFMRFFRRDAVTGYAGPINEHPELAPGARVAQLDESFLIPMPPLGAVLRKWMRYQGIIAGDARGRGLRTWWRDDVPARWREVKWLAWRVWKTRRAEPGPHMPLRYDLARVGFHLAGIAAGGVGSLVPGGRVSEVRP